VSNDAQQFYGEAYWPIKALRTDLAHVYRQRPRVRSKAALAHLVRGDAGEEYPFAQAGYLEGRPAATGGDDGGATLFVCGRLLSHRAGECFDEAS